jgi:hypothetical protein
MSHSISPSPSPIDIKSLLSEFDASGLRAAAFARSKGLPPWKLYGALRRRSGKVRARSARARLKEPAFVPVRVVDAQASSSPLELLLAGGHRLLLGPDFDVSTLRRLLEVFAACWVSRPRLRCASSSLARRSTCARASMGPRGWRSTRGLELGTDLPQTEAPEMQLPISSRFENP